MATPHVAGAIALLWSMRPELRHQITDTENILNDAAVDVSTTSCGSSGVPNNVYGFGRLDIKAAVDVAAASISPISQSFSGGGAVNVTAPSGVGWQTFVNDSWITVTSGGSGSGNGAVNYSVAANTGSARTGTMIIAGRVFTVTQDALACSYSISPMSASYTSAGGSGIVSVIAGSGCAWTAVSGASWITITSGASGSGNGAVNYSVATNAGAARSGTITVASQTFTITQSAPILNTGWLSPTANAAVTSQAGDNSGATWTATKSTTTLSTTKTAYVLGGAADTWGQTWGVAEMSNANFRIRIANVASDTSRDFSLDWAAVRVSYQP